jgi:hypothetical protein
MIHKLATNVTTVTATDPVTIKFPGRVGIVVQTEVTGTVTAVIQGRSDDSAPWVNIGSPVTPNTIAVNASGPLMPKMRLNVTANSGSISAWLIESDI